MHIEINKVVIGELINLSNYIKKILLNSIFYKLLEYLKSSILVITDSIFSLKIKILF